MRNPSHHCSFPWDMCQVMAGLLAQMGIAPLHKCGVVLNLGPLIHCFGKCFPVAGLSWNWARLGCALCHLSGTSCNLSCHDRKVPSLLKKLPFPMRIESPAGGHAVTPSCTAPSQLPSPDCPGIILVAHLSCPCRFDAPRS